MIIAEHQGRDVGAIDGSMSVSVAAVKSVGSSKFPGSWMLSARIRRGNAMIFDRQTTLSFGSEDDASERDSECAAALRDSRVTFLFSLRFWLQAIHKCLGDEIQDVWRRMTCCEDPSLCLPKSFSGARSFSIEAKKYAKNKRWRWTCASRASGPQITYARQTTTDFACEALAGVGAAASFRDELLSAWTRACTSDPEQRVPAETRHVLEEGKDDPGRGRQPPGPFSNSGSQ